MNHINYNDFMQHKTVLHSHGNYTGALLLLNSSPTATATYSVNKVIVIPVSQLITDGTVFYYDYELIPEMDIIDSINVTSTSKPFIIRYYIDDIEYNPSVMKEYLSTCAPYSKFIIRIMFIERPTETVTLNVSYREFVLNIDDRDNFCKSIVKTSTNTYLNGVCMARTYKHWQFINNGTTMQLMGLAWRLLSWQVCSQ